MAYTCILYRLHHKASGVLPDAASVYVLASGISADTIPGVASGVLAGATPDPASQVLAGTNPFPVSGVLADASPAIPASGAPAQPPACSWVRGLTWQPVCSWVSSPAFNLLPSPCFSLRLLWALHWWSCQHLFLVYWWWSDRHLLLFCGSKHPLRPPPLRLNCSSLQSVFPPRLFCSNPQSLFSPRLFCNNLLSLLLLWPCCSSLLNLFAPRLCCSPPWNLLHPRPHYNSVKHLLPLSLSCSSSHQSLWNPCGNFPPPLWSHSNRWFWSLQHLSWACLLIPRHHWLIEWAPGHQSLAWLSCNQPAF